MPARPALSAVSTFGYEQAFAQGVDGQAYRSFDRVLFFSTPYLHGLLVAADALEWNAFSFLYRHHLATCGGKDIAAAIRVPTEKSIFALAVSSLK